MAGDGALRAGRAARGRARTAAALALLLAIVLLATEDAAEAAAAAIPGPGPGPLPGLANYLEEGDDPAAGSAALDDYSDNDLARFVKPVKRACVRRGGNCDHRPNDCCYNSSCRCNLWGANCRCQRMGLFQKWGKK